MATPITTSATTSAFRIGLIQIACSSDISDNTARTISRVREAAASGAQVICLQELFYSHYLCQEENPDVFDLAIEIPGTLTDTFCTLAAELEVVIILPVFEKRARGLYHNSAGIIDADGTLLGIYRKMHIPDDPQFYEKFYFTPGDLGFRAWDTRYGRIGVCICWDQWFPEAARLTALDGADVLFYPTAIGWLPSEKAEFGERQQDSWETVQRGHAIANGCYVAAANRIGHEAPAGGEGIEFWGQSFIADPFGQIIERAPSDSESVLIADVDPAQIEEQRRIWPFLRDRRIDAYSGITQRHTKP
ncbi:MAG: N-carbamoylputrescine amidase [Verrucomicrobiales bacterium]|jgi:N-carbamoylputrescine amidase